MNHGDAENTEKQDISLKRASAFWLGLALVVVIAAIPRLLSYDFSLPYVDHPDEPNYYLAGLEWRGLYDNQGYYDGAPPAYIAFHAGLQPILESLGIRGLAATVQVMRLIAVAANLATLVFIALIARRAAGNLAGLVAGAAWGVSPLVLENGVYALPDPFVYLFTALSVWLAGESLASSSSSLLRRGERNARHRVRWCVWSAVAGLLAVLFKYPALPVLAAGGTAALAISLRDKRRGTRYLAVQAGMALVMALWLVYGYGIDFNNLQREGAAIRESGLSNFFNLSRTINNVYHVFAPLNPLLYAVVIGSGIAAYVLARRRGLPRAQMGIAGLCLLIVLTIPWLANTFSLVTPEDIRYVLPATTAACALLGIAVGQILYVIPNRYKLTAGMGIAGLLIILVLVPQAIESWRIVEEREPPDRRVALRQYVDVNLEPGTILVTQENHKTFNPFWGGIPYRNWVDWWMMDSIMERSPQEWREDSGISYAVLPFDQRQEMEESEAGRDYLASLLHLRDFVTPGERGPAMAIYRLWRMEVETQVWFGDAILLTGYDQNAEQAMAGESISFRFYWQAAATPDDNYSLFIHLTSPDAYTPLAQADGAPAVPERPTLTWDDPGETLISPLFTLAIPPDLPAGDYRVLIGLYNYMSGQRLRVRDGGGNAVGDAWEAARITIGPG